MKCELIAINKFYPNFVMYPISAEAKLSEIINYAVLSDHTYSILQLCREIHAFYVHFSWKLC